MTLDGSYFGQPAPRDPMPLPTSLALVSEILDAVRSGAGPEALAATPMPNLTRAVFVRRDEQHMFDDVASKNKDPRKSLHLDEGTGTRTRADEVYLAVMASSINFNTVWTSIFEPLPTFGFLDRLAKESVLGARHGLDFTWWVRTLRASCCARDRSCEIGRSVTRSPCTVITWTTKTRVVTTTRCLPATSASGFRDELWRSRGHRGREGESTHAQANPFDLGRSGR